jgi:hypothetical protein
MDKEFAKANLISLEDKEKLRNLLAGFGFQFSSCLNYDYGDSRFDRIEEKIIDQIAFGFLIKNKFGGPERKIFTKKDEFKLGKVYEVWNKRTVKTGTRISGGGMFEDYEPPYLKDVKSHTILSLYSCSSGKFEIESTNVEKIDKDYKEIEEDKELAF